MNLEGKVALVTGAGRGIGEGIATELAKAGATVAVADVDIDIARQASEKIKNLGRKSLALQVNVADKYSVSKMIEDVESHFGGIDVAVNNAGIVSLYPISDLTPEEWDKIMSVNARGVFLCTQAEIGSMRKRGSGSIINVSSIAGKSGFPELSHYSASKFAVIGFTNAVAKEVATEGITINALCPGIVGTGMWRGESGLSARWALEGESEEESWKRHQKTFLPQGVAQTPEDMGKLAVYLASAPHVTGQAIAVDGGFSL